MNLEQRLEMALDDGPCPPDTYQTPERYLEPVRALLSGVIGLDPCTTAANPTQAREFFTEADDGLTKPWAVFPPFHGVFLNPPWSRKLGKPIDPWLVKCHEEAGEGVEIVALVPVATATKWWRRHVETAAGVCFVHGRIAYIDPRTGKPVQGSKFDSAYVYFGDRFRAFKREFSALGWVVEGRGA